MDTTCPLVLLFLLLFIISFFFIRLNVQLKLKITFLTIYLYIIFFSIFFKIIYHKIKTVESIRTQGMLKVGRRVSLDMDTPIGQAHRHPHVSRSLIKLNAVVVF